MEWSQERGSCLPSGHCPGNAFSCGNSQCVTKVNPECDDTADCSDGSDEAHCGQSACLACFLGYVPFPGSSAGSLAHCAHHTQTRGPGIHWSGAEKGSGHLWYDRKPERQAEKGDLEVCGVESLGRKGEKNQVKPWEALNARNWGSVL